MAARKEGMPSFFKLCCVGEGITERASHSHGVSFTNNTLRGWFATLVNTHIFLLRVR